MTVFKWACLAIATLALAGFGWAVNDIRLEIKRATDRVNQDLPEILTRAKTSSETLNANLPGILEKTRATTATLAALSEDVRELRDLAGLTATGPRPEGLVKYADGVLDLVEASGGTIGLHKLFGGKGLKDTAPAREWVVPARKEALFLTLTAKSRGEILTRLCKNKFGSSWYIQFAGKEPVPLADWLKANHPPSKEL